MRVVGFGAGLHRARALPEIKGARFSTRMAPPAIGGDGPFTTTTVMTLGSNRSQPGSAIELMRNRAKGPRGKTIPKGQASASRSESKDTHLYTSLPRASAPASEIG